MSTSTTPAAQPFTDYAALQQFLATLPPPAPGKVRVYRGQSKNYPQILASGARPVQPPNVSLFDFATRIVAQDLLQQPVDADLELNMLMFWIQAVAQHYGPSSWYLDVTHSLDMALWFALHAAENKKVYIPYGPGDKADPSTDILSTETWLRFQPAQVPGYLYVFDVPKYSSAGSVAHGDLVDLAEAPPVFSSSHRMQAQKACLLACGTDPQRADLSDCLITPPISVNWPMAGAPGLDRTIDDVFPGPAIDEWYRRLLTIPLVPCPDAEEPTRLSIGHPLPVTIYLSDNAEARQAVLNCAAAADPVLTYSAVPEHAFALPKPEGGDLLTFSSKDATLLLLESPLMFITPPAENEGWNQALLCQDISDNVPVYNAAGQVTGQAALNNVFVEFSPLEDPDSSGGQLGRIRGAWLVRSGKEMAFNLFCQQSDGGTFMDVALRRIVSDAASGRMHYAAMKETPAGKQIEWHDLLEVPMVAKPLFTVLMLLREISPLWKALPLPSLVVDAGTDSQKMMVDVSHGSARLLSVQDTRNG
ncbi:MAG: FRG domain-containing protein, partial [Acidobacteriales bacterium]|nr:FRG domain-containing protein [Terriglobales bacterium]